MNKKKLMLKLENSDEIYLIMKIINQKKKKKNTVLSLSHHLGAYNTIFKPLLDSNMQFYRYLHMTLEDFQYLKTLVMPVMNKEYPHSYKISNEEKLIIALRYVILYLCINFNSYLYVATKLDLKLYALC